jgi:hypothetical protein
MTIHRVFMVFPFLDRMAVSADQYRRREHKTKQLLAGHFSSFSIIQILQRSALMRIKGCHAHKIRVQIISGIEKGAIALTDLGQ